VVLPARLELARPYERKILSLVCLPVSLRHTLLRSKEYREHF